MEGTGRSPRVVEGGYVARDTRTRLFPLPAGDLLPQQADARLPPDCPWTAPGLPLDCPTEPVQDGPQPAARTPPTLGISRAGPTSSSPLRGQGENRSRPSPELSSRG